MPLREIGSRPALSLLNDGGPSLPPSPPALSSWGDVFLPSVCPNTRRQHHLMEHYPSQGADVGRRFLEAVGSSMFIRGQASWADLRQSVTRFSSSAVTFPIAEIAAKLKCATIPYALHAWRSHGRYGTRQGICLHYLCQQTVSHSSPKHGFKAAPAPDGPVLNGMGG